MLQIEEIHFLFEGFPFFVMSKSFHVRFRLLLAWNIPIFVFLTIFVFSSLRFCCSFCFFFCCFFFILRALGDGFSLEFEWHQVSTNRLNSSQYTGRYHIPVNLSHSCQLVGFPYSLRDIDSPHVYRTLFTILADITNAVDLDSSSDFQLFPIPFFQTFSECSKHIYKNWYYIHPSVQFSFSSISSCNYLFPYSLSFIFILSSAGIYKTKNSLVVFCFVFVFFVI